MLDMLRYSTVLARPSLLRSRSEGREEGGGCLGLPTPGHCSQSERKQKRAKKNGDTVGRVLTRGRRQSALVWPRLARLCIPATRQLTSQSIDCGYGYWPFGSGTITAQL